MSKRLILFTIALLLILTFALAQDQQDSNRKPPQQPDGDSNNNNNNGSGNQQPNQQDKPKKDQQNNNGKQGRPNNNNDSELSQQESNHNNNDRQSNHHNNRRGPRGFPFVMIFSFSAYLISAISLIVACGAGIAFIILKKKGYSISIQKKEASHQPLREEEELPSQYLPQVPVVNVMMPQHPSVPSSQPIVGMFYPNLQLPIQQENPEQKV